MMKSDSLFLSDCSLIALKYSLTECLLSAL